VKKVLRFNWLVLFVVSVGLTLAAPPVDGSSVSAQQVSWASSLFEKPTHDFGTVARGALTEHVFEFKNNTGSDIVVGGVRASCGCTTPSIVKQVVKAGEIGGIRAKLNTMSFLGQKGATITVTFNSPNFTEVQLRVDGYVRRDIVFNPGVCDFGEIEEGKSAKKTITLEYAGRADWKVERVTCGNPACKLELKETHRGGGRVGYEVICELADDAPAGSLHTTELMFETNDQRLKRVPLAMSGKVVSPIEISPNMLFLSEVKKGASLDKSIFVKGKSEFEITSLQVSSEGIQATKPEGKKTLFRIPISITVPDVAGPFAQEIVLTTNMNGLTRTIKVVGEVVE
jgi:Protein of unknown function (DUF1573)